MDSQSRIVVLTGGTGGAKFVDEAENAHFLKGDEMVSMNMLGFTPAVFEQLERQLSGFLESSTTTPANSELPIPVAVNEILKAKTARMRVLPTSDRWFGVTHSKDKPAAVEAIRELVERGEYPSPIWREG